MAAISSRNPVTTVILLICWNNLDRLALGLLAVALCFRIGQSSVFQIIWDHRKESEVQTA
jgi:hypothetical protein